MGLLNIKNHKLEIKPEALAIRNIRFVWDRDKSKNKTKAEKELSYIYFMYDPRSDYDYITDIEDRQSVVALEVGLGSTYEPDPRMIDAIESYKKSITTVSSGLLEDTKYTVNKIRKFLVETEIEDITDADKMVRTLERVPGLVENIIKTQELVNSEIVENNTMRGKKEKKIMEDGLIL